MLFDSVKASGVLVCFYYVTSLIITEITVMENEVFSPVDDPFYMSPMTQMGRVIKALL